MEEINEAYSEERELPKWSESSTDYADDDKTIIQI